MLKKLSRILRDMRGRVNRSFHLFLAILLLSVWMIMGAGSSGPNGFPDDINLQAAAMPEQGTIPTRTPTPPNTPTDTPIPTDTPTNTPLPTHTPTDTPIPPTPTLIATNTLVPTATATNTLTPTTTATNTLTPTATATNTLTPTNTPTFPLISVAGATSPEGDLGSTPLGFVVSRSHNFYANTIGFTTVNGSADGTDFAPAIGQVILPAGGPLTATVNISITGDTIVEPVETFTLNLTSALNGTLGASSAVGQILNDDSSQLILTGGGSNTESDLGVVNYPYQAQLTNGVQGGLAVNYTVVNGTAQISDGDFSSFSGTLIFSGAAGEIQPFNIGVSGDQKVEGDETFSVAFSSIAPANVAFINNSIPSDILNNDSASVQLSGSQTQNEGDSGLKAYNFTVTVDNPVQGGFEVVYSTEGISATAGEDFEENDGSLSFAGGQGESKTITVFVKGDELLEDDETFSVVLNGISDTPFGGDISLDTQAEIGTIDNDDFATLTLSGGTSKNEQDSGTVAYTFTIELDGDVPNGFEVIYKTNDGSATTADNDYQDNDGTLLFAGSNGETKTVTVLVNGDDRAEAHETFQVEIESISADGQEDNILIVNNPQTAVITNDDAAAFFLDLGSGLASEFDKSVPFSIVLSNFADANVTIEYETVDGSATAGEDYEAVSGSVTFAPGELVKVIQVPILEDLISESQESFTVVLSNPSLFDLGSPSSGIVTILDNDSIPQVNIKDAVTEVLEAEEVVNVELLLSQSFALPVSVILQINEGTASNGADYDPTIGEVVFAPGETQKIIQIPIVSDTIYERNEDLTIEVVEVENGELGDSTEMLIKIIEDDPVPLVALSNVTKGEAIAGIELMLFNIELTHLSEVDIFIDFETKDLTAKAYEDYLPASGRLRIRAGNRVGTIGVPILGDRIKEDDETFILTLLSSSEGVLDSTTGNLSVLGTIKNVEVQSIFFPAAFSSGEE